MADFNILKIAQNMHYVFYNICIDFLFFIFNFILEKYLQLNYYINAFYIIIYYILLVCKMI